MYDSTSLLDRDREGKSCGLREQGAKFLLQLHSGHQMDFHCPVTCYWREENLMVTNVSTTGESLTSHLLRKSLNTEKNPLPFSCLVNLI